MASGTEDNRALARGELVRWTVVRWLFELLYNNRTLYWLASTIPFAGQWRVWQRLALERVVGSETLEVGCGIGTLLADTLERGYHARAVDRSTQMVAATRRELRRRGLRVAPETVQQASVQALPFTDASFDTVISTFPTDYITDPATLAEIARVLRPGGRLVIVLGASLLPARFALRPLVALQRLVYGRTASGQATARCASGVSGALAERLREVGLAPRTECVSGPCWVAYLVMAEKARRA
ncbi:MAG TPA: class I SAM-dependent methyltransferase [Ktedonobacterales bacterium]